MPSRFPKYVLTSNQALLMSRLPIVWAVIIIKAASSDSSSIHPSQYGRTCSIAHDITPLLPSLPWLLYFAAGLKSSNTIHLLTKLSPSHSSLLPTPQYRKVFLSLFSLLGMIFSIYTFKSHPFWGLFQMLHIQKDSPVTATSSSQRY